MSQNANVHAGRTGGLPRLLWPELARVYAIAGVVLLHSAAVPNTQFGKIPMDDWWQTNVWFALVVTSIPLFVMLSGALLLNQAAWDARRFARRRLAKVLLPLPAWTLIYAAWRHFAWGQDVGAGDVLKSFLTGIGEPIFPHLWFMYLILSLYLLVPILRVFFLNASRNVNLYFAALWFVASAIKPLVEQGYGIKMGYYLEPVLGYVGYFLLGAVIHRHFPARLGWLPIAVCCATVAACYAVTVAGTYHLSYAAGKLDRYFYGDFSLTVIPMSIASFVLLRHFGTALSERAGDHPRLVASIIALGGLSFGIYLSHALVIVLLESGRLGFALGPTSFEPVLAVPVMAAAVFAASAALTYVIRRSRMLSWLTP